MTESETKELISLCLNRYKLANDYLEGKMIKLAKSLTEAEIPGYENKPLDYGVFEQKEFVVMMTDIRRSTDIMHSYNGRRKMFIIYYIYSSLVSKIVAEYGGTSTEFLGDGVLNLFSTKKNGLGNTLKDTYLASKKILESRFIMNAVFNNTGLPQIDFGVGIDFGMTIVTRFGYSSDNDLKAFGECVYDVSKLSKGTNKIYISKNADDNWPISSDGKLIVDYEKNINGIDCYFPHT